MREGKRLVGDWVWTQHKPNVSKVHRTIGLGSYNFDSHYVSRIIQRTGDASKDTIVKEGRIKVQMQMPAGDAPSPSPSPPPPPSSGLGFGCAAFGAHQGVVRCVAGMPTGSTAGNGSDASCRGACPALAAHEWLAVKRLSSYVDGNKTLVVQLPTGETSSWLKKSKRLAHTLPPSLKLAVTEGERIPIASGPDSIDTTYDLVQLTQTTTSPRGGSGGDCSVCMDKPFAMPYDAMLPKASEVSNLLPVLLLTAH